MKLGDYLYIAAAILFAWMTFLIIRNYYRKKFNDQGQRMDMLDEYEGSEKDDKEDKNYH